MILMARGPTQLVVQMSHDRIPQLGCGKLRQFNSHQITLGSYQPEMDCC